jgi:hypothetical protein
MVDAGGIGRKVAERGTRSVKVSVSLNGHCFDSSINAEENNAQHGADPSNRIVVLRLARRYVIHGAILSQPTI